MGIKKCINHLGMLLLKLDIYVLCFVFRPLRPLCFTLLLHPLRLKCVAIVLVWAAPIMDLSICHYDFRSRHRHCRRRNDDRQLLSGFIVHFTSTQQAHFISRADCGLPNFLFTQRAEVFVMWFPRAQQNTTQVFIIDTVRLPVSSARAQ